MQNTQPKRTRILTVRFTPNEYARLKAMAHAAEIELSAYVRSMLVDAEVPRRARGKSPNIAALGKTLVALNRIGNNLNQIARVAHRIGDVTVYDQANSDRALVAAAAQAVVAALDDNA